MVVDERAIRGRSRPIAKNWTFHSTPPITARASPKSACAGPGSSGSGTNTCRSRCSMKQRIVLHDRQPAAVAVIVTQTLKNPLGSMPLLQGPLDFYTSTAGLPGRFSDGFCRRRAQLSAPVKKNPSPAFSPPIFACSTFKSTTAAASAAAGPEPKTPAAPHRHENKGGWALPRPARGQAPGPFFPRKTKNSNRLIIWERREFSWLRQQPATDTRVRLMAAGTATKGNGIIGSLTLCGSRGAASRRDGRALAFLIFVPMRLHPAATAPSRR